MVMKVYSPEFKADAVALYLSDPSHTFEGIGKDLGISRETLRNSTSPAGSLNSTFRGPVRDRTGPFVRRRRDQRGVMAMPSGGCRWAG